MSKVAKSDAEWRSRVMPEQCRVTRGQSGAHRAALLERFAGPRLRSVLEIRLLPVPAGRSFRLCAATPSRHNARP